MHLAIQQGVDKINSLQADMLLSEEIDIELNKSMSRFINTRYGKNNIYQKGFEQSQKRIDDLRSLVREYSASVTFKEQYNNEFWVDKFRLPSDYLYLVNQRSELFLNDCTPIGWYLEDNTPTAYFILPLTHLYINPVTGLPVVGTVSGFVASFQMIADPNNLTYGQIGTSLTFSQMTANMYTYPQDLETVRTELIDPINWSSGFEWYWEVYGTLNVPGSFIIIVDTSVHPWFNWDASNPVTTNTTLVTQLIGGFDGVTTGWTDPTNPTVYAQYTDTALGAKRRVSNEENTEYAFNKFIQQDDIFKLLEDPFNTTKYTSPLTTMRGQYIDIYTSDIFVIDKVKITYIRKPKRISLSLGVSCELPEHTHQEIVDRTVSSILEGINDPRYKVHQLEVSKNE